ncbi:helix-turn-helix domain-containing protein [Nocardia terpenica]|uniref:GntR family transcriptional regulator n=1 Tax=Nocardia terpenica TaxID=455432 RepID=UPI0012FE626E|nr:GntR family transcriptional regulator [Nocardia terpenica]
MRTGIGAETAVLGVLVPGGMLTVDQIAQQAQLTNWSARRAVTQLASRGLVMVTPHRARWSITPRGRAAWAAKSRRYSA